MRTSPFVAGAFVPGEAATRLVDPWTGVDLAEVSFAGAHDVACAIAAARTAFDDGDWSHRAPAERGAQLDAVADGILARLDEFARLEAQNAGKPLAAVRREIEGAAGVFRYYAGAMDKFFGETIPLGSGLLDMTLREPLGVVAQIVPWNFPLLGASWKVAPALAAGCTALLKPSPATPLTALLLAEVVAEAGVPAGVLSVLPGGAEVGRALAEDPAVDGIAFTGSTRVGAEVMRLAAGTIKRVALELGGKNANIVFADADLDRAVASAVGSAFGNAGQSCSARSRLLVERPLYDTFLARFAEAAAAVRTGAYDDTATTLGPLISASHRAGVHAAVEEALAAGARLVTGGTAIDGPGAFYPATILAAEADNPAFHREIFGPVATVTPFDTEGEAIALANASEYGLNGSVWSRDISVALRVARAVRTGMVAVNGLPSASRTSVYAPFGGYKRSGIGRELGMHGLEFYTEVKNVVVDLS
ncbi:aldehyde dehydrogenase family protein [Acuticoccus mangrovi]|uniref:Aldehyde dehydrogenase n=1 Tax=Acuticoccus mangrovi TaxID=2796142 RepID=A0A934MJG5_9HYPH|nr:aldehyde dehydrogenase family protein [Acuticoccus mangrovi]MBJ3774539.1 aldehyde dehydrogenase [Acuticoccus mangrovi]